MVLYNVQNSIGTTRKAGTFPVMTVYDTAYVFYERIQSLPGDVSHTTAVYTSSWH